MRPLHTLALAGALALALGNTGIARAFQPPAPASPAPDEATADDRTPPRLSYIDGQVSFWRPGAPEWVAAQTNIALAPGDELSTGSPGNFEIQVGARAFIRAWGGTVLGLVNQDPDFLQIKVTAGHASLDLRALEPGRVVELDTPGAAFTIEGPGYYRVHVDGDRTSFITRRDGRATVTPANGQAASIAPNEEVVVEGDAAPRVASAAAPPPDDWDRWNQTRGDYVAEAVSARYVSAGVYGVSDLDRYGRWRNVSDYGPVWVPTSVAPDWVPYSTGSWTWDPAYGWTWTDTAPWGWAPFHYGRWVYVDNYWGWAPGPVIARPAYSPALVAFFGGGPSVSARLGWVALGFGEPVVPWWGRPRFVGVPWWGGWGGPRIVNNVVIGRGVSSVPNITLYRNVHAPNAVVAVESQRFGRGGIGTHRLAHIEVRSLEPVRGRLEIRPSAVSLVPTTVRGVQPSDNRHVRPVVATRGPQRLESGGGSEAGPRGPAREGTWTPRLVPAPRPSSAAVESPRVPSGQGPFERPQSAPSPRGGGSIQPRSPEVTVPGNRQPATPGRELAVPLRPESGSAGGREQGSPPREPRVNGPIPSTPQGSPPRGERPVVAPSSPPGRELAVPLRPESGSSGGREQGGAPPREPRVNSLSPSIPQGSPPRGERPAVVPSSPPGRDFRNVNPQTPAAQTPPARVDTPRPQELPRVQTPRPQQQPQQAAPRVESPRPQGRSPQGEAAGRPSSGGGGSTPPRVEQDGSKGGRN